MSTNNLPEGAHVLTTRIPEGRTVPGITYGAHVSGPGWSGYWVRTGSVPQWGIARLTPADDELVGNDRDIRMAIDDELEAEHSRIVHAVLDHYEGEPFAHRVAEAGSQNTLAAVVEDYLAFIGEQANARGETYEESASRLDDGVMRIAAHRWQELETDGPEPYRYEHGSLYEYRPDRRAYVHVLKTTARTKAQAVAEYEQEATP